MCAYRSDSQSIIITGASSGIGQALAEYYAAPDVVLGLTGRDAQRLGQVAALCRDKGAIVVEGLVDVTDRQGMYDWICSFDAAHPVDLVVANAGISAGTGGVLIGEPADQVRHVFDVNLNGVLNTIEPLQEKMIERGSGQIAIMSSLAGYRGWPGAPAYCGSKAAVRVYGEALRGALWKTGIRVNVICPGFVESRMTSVNDFPMPHIIKSDKAAEIIGRGLRKNKGRIAFPTFPAFMAWVFMVVFDCISQKILSYMPSKSKKSE
ncbi:MAG: SDR family NAD(P)-dependent oxidoreductase [Alphaproteobacteria bacterium]